MYIPKGACIEMLRDNKIPFVIKCASDDNISCRFEFKMKIESEHANMLKHLLLACTAACFHLEHLRDLSFTGEFHPNEDGDLQIENLCVIVEEENGRYSKLDWHLSAVLEYDHTGFIKNGFLSDSSVAALDMARDITEMQLYKFMEESIWEGLQEADNQYGFTVDYGKEFSEQEGFSYQYEEEYYL